MYIALAFDRNSIYNENLESKYTGFVVLRLLWVGLRLDLITLPIILAVDASLSKLSLRKGVVLFKVAVLIMVRRVVYAL